MYRVSYDNYIADFYVIMGNLRMHVNIILYNLYNSITLYNSVINLCLDPFTKNMILHKYS